MTDPRDRRTSAHDPRDPSEATSREEELLEVASKLAAEKVKRLEASGRIPRGTIEEVLRSPSVSEAWHDYLRSREVEGLVASTITVIERISRRLLEVIDPDLLLIELRPSDLEDWIVAMRRRGLAESTIHMHGVWVGSWIRWCRSRGWRVNIEKMAEIRVPQSKRRTVTAEEIEELISVVDRTKFDGHRFVVQAYLMLDTGARVGEVCGMDVQDVSRDRRTIRVFGKGSRERDLYLSDSVASLLDEWIIRRDSSVEAAGIESDVLFPSLEGKRQDSRQVGERFRFFSAKAGISPNIHAHLLRHTWATRHVESGTNALLLKQLGGWSGMDVVNTYVHDIRGDVAQTSSDRASMAAEMLGGRSGRRGRRIPRD